MILFKMNYFQIHIEIRSLYNLKFNHHFLKDKVFHNQNIWMRLTSHLVCLFKIKKALKQLSNKSQIKEKALRIKKIYRDLKSLFWEEKIHILVYQKVSSSKTWKILAPHRQIFNLLQSMIRIRKNAKNSANIFWKPKDSFFVSGKIKMVNLVLGISKKVTVIFGQFKFKMSNLIQLWAFLAGLIIQFLLQNLEKYMCVDHLFMASLD